MVYPLLHHGTVWEIFLQYSGFQEIFISRNSRRHVFHILVMVSETRTNDCIGVLIILRLWKINLLFNKNFICGNTIFDAPHYITMHVVHIDYVFKISFKWSRISLKILKKCLQGTDIGQNVVRTSSEPRKNVVNESQYAHCLD